MTIQFSKGISNRSEEDKNKSDIHIPFKSQSNQLFLHGSIISEHTNFFTAEFQIN